MSEIIKNLLIFYQIYLIKYIGGQIRTINILLKDVSSQLSVN